ncbi:restriction endonuclease subunit S [Ferrimicrobium acidiphilum]|uniref:EcoKI restriction-modification system protein HsdS n=1 Tax=Ferrimicrobium acidiphilum DSM 19497 TaxID=1121877 RepID=A0A0D8FWZ5_9ACTN|nr:restriction endonuclease subunit S [Ferrimicrobium acidiphilum]KJE76777.1 EcoKI restriction-modification system protein HsdS [Ferrimicrobium acidiphilum DSM 19497]
MSAIKTLPSDWTVGLLEHISIKIQDGTHFSPKLGGTEFKYITSKNVGPGRLRLESVETISREEHEKIYHRCDVRYGDLLLTKDGANTGNATINLFREEISLLSSVAFIRANPRRSIESYILQYLLSAAGRKQVEDAMAGNAITRLTLAKIKDLRIPLPPVPEQRAIAEVLTDADDFISTLERLIKKKEAIKQGMMQELLTGRTRLPGFNGSWSKTTLGNHVTYVRTVPLSRDQLDVASRLKYLHYGDIHTRTSPFLNASQEEMPRASSHLAGKTGHLRVGDLIFADASEDYAGVGKSVELVGVPTEGVIAGLHTIAARFDKSVLADGFKAYLQHIPSFRQGLLRLAAGTKVLATTRSYISSIDVSLPSTKEQQAIAGVLTDCEQEIAVLGHRLDKARAIKQGMMQQLLTGRTRLPVAETMT